MNNKYDLKICKLFKQAEKEKEILGHEYVGTEHLMLAILKSDDEIVSLLNNFNLTYDKFFIELKNSLPPVKVKRSNMYTPLLKNVIKNSEDNLTCKNLLFNILEEGEGIAIRLLTMMDIDVDSLYNFLRNENDENLEIYKYGKRLKKYIIMDEKVIGRDKEINLIIQTLLRKKKNNPILIGDAGVGKSAIVEEIQRKIVCGDVPDSMLDKEIVCLEMGSLVANTRYRGEFEERLMNIIEEVKEHNNIILFIDEIHTMACAGAADGAIGAGDILKPYLARGDIKCIGATTKDEYEKYLCKDKALQRRFEVIYINEPNKEETFNIISNIKKEYESFHKVLISDENIKTLIDLSDMYFPYKKNPDKSLELLDSVMSYVKLKNNKNIIKEKEIELKKIKMNKYLEVEKGNFKSALKNNILENELELEIKNLKSSIKNKITKDDILDILEYKNNIILKKENILTLKDNYSKKIIDLIFKKIKNQNKNISLMLNIENKNLIKDISKAINYEIYYLNKNNIEGLFKKIKYYPSMIITTKDDDSYEIKNLLSKIYKDNLVEYNNEYYNFNNTITITYNKDNSLGFNSEFVSNIPIDQIINLSSIK